MLTDTHAHLDFPDFAADLDAVLNRARKAGVHRFITIGTTIEGSRRAIELADRFPMVWATVGVHPSNAMEAPDDVLTPLRELAKHPRVVALGECGLDYHRLPGAGSLSPQPAYLAEMPLNDPREAEASVRDGAVKAKQSLIFEQQLDLAVETALPLVIHERDAWADTLAQLDPFTGKARAVFHCFGKGFDQAGEVLARGHLVSFTGIVTFKNAASVHDCATRLAAGSFMVETDCPFLAPVPFRGKRCEPAHVRTTAERIAAMRGVPLDQLAAETETTVNGFFRFRR
ncbi:MAG: TatD family hydrolase [Chthoniobacteraceae bacterium]